MQLYFYTVIESIDDGLQRLSIRDVDFSGNCGTVFMSLFAQYVRYGRCRIDDGGFRDVQIAVSAIVRC